MRIGTGDRAVVLGLGRFGGGVGVTRWLADRGATVLVTDLLPAERLQPSLDTISDLVDAGRVELRLGGHDERDIDTASHVVPTPAIPRPWANELLLRAIDRGIPIVTEIELLLRHLPTSSVIGVTGSSGKSTTAAMVAHALERSGVRCHLGGNIGGSLLTDLPQIGAHDWVVLELSSFMLWWLDRATDLPWPRIGAITNFTPNHLDWHETLDGYRNAKAALLRHLDRDGVAILGRDPTLDDWPGALAATVLRLEQDSGPRPLAIPGAHNRRNADLAVAIARVAIGDVADDLCDDFTGLAHRLELVADRDGARFYNDSKSTTPQATIQAVRSFSEPKRVHLIAGGYDKGSDLDAIAGLARDLAGLYTIGATGDDIARRADLAEVCGTLEAAMDAIRPRLHDGDVVLLSPGCASWDQFDNFEERGARFTRIAREGQS